VLGRHIVAQIVAVVVVRPELARGRVEREPHRIAEPGRKRMRIRAVEVVAGNGRPWQRVVAHVARGADGEVEQVIGPERDRSREVRALREVRDERHRCRRAGIEPLHRGLLGEVHRVATEREAEGVGQAAQDGALGVRNAVAVRVYQPDDLARIREGDEDRASGTERERARAVQPVRKEIDVEPVWNEEILARDMDGTESERRCWVSAAVGRDGVRAAVRE